MEYTTKVHLYTLKIPPIGRCYNHLTVLSVEPIDAEKFLADRDYGCILESGLAGNGSGSHNGPGCVDCAAKPCSRDNIGEAHPFGNDRKKDHHRDCDEKDQGNYE